MRRLAPPQRKTTLRVVSRSLRLSHARPQDAWRTLVAVEMGMKNHEFVPAPLVDTIAGLRNGA